MNLEKVTAVVGELSRSENVEDLSEARRLLLAYSCKFGKENEALFLAEAARIHTIILEELEEKYDFRIKDIDLGDIPSLEV